MTRYTSYSQTFTLPRSIDTDSIRSLYVTYKKDDFTFEQTIDDVEISGHDVIVNLSQEETGAFPVGRIQVQLRYALEDDTAYASGIEWIYCKDVLKQGVI